MVEDNVDNKLLYKAVIDAAVLTVASCEIITARKRNKRIVFKCG